MNKETWFETPFVIGRSRSLAARIPEKPKNEFEAMAAPVLDLMDGLLDLMA